MNPAEFEGREQRITFQLYNYWFGLADNCGIPPLKALSPGDIATYKNNMVLIDLRDPDDEPTLQVIGQLLSDDLDLDLTLKGISEIPRRSLLSRITDHYMEVLANKAPISFDAEFKNNAREKILYRGILLPFSDDGENINFILGAIRWISEEEALAVKEPTNDEDTRPQDNDSDAPLLQETLQACRKLVHGQSPTDQRSRRSLYETLGAVLDFYVLCAAHPNSYQQLLDAEGLKAQKRAPFTPILKLCFGRDYDKTRITEYAAALSHAVKNNQDGTRLPDFLDQFPGGIKGCVLAERNSRSGTEGQNTPDYKILDQIAPVAQFDLDQQDDDQNEFCLLLGRRNGPQMDVLKILDKDRAMLNRILAKFAKEQKT